MLPLRTMRCRLLQLHTRFSMLVAEVCGDQARHYLAETSWSLNRIAQKVGYSNAANQRQAVKRCTDESLQRFRSRIRTQQTARTWDVNRSPT
ncbi:hypothetical protein [Massilia orientalis]|uniref:Uncharacterized protein n=1 Tax=Massilia orientalis TaxID=3050128 RepID=A0ACC7ML10_9BURK